MAALLPLLAPLLLLAFAILFTIAYVRLQRSEQPTHLRPLPGVETLRDLADRSIEEGQRIHLGLGTGSVTDSRAAETLMGMVVLEILAEQAARGRSLPIVTTADPASQLLAADQLRRSQQGQAWAARAAARFVAPQPAAYGAATRGAMQREGLGITALVGYLGDEYLFLAAEQPAGGSPMSAPQLAATTHLESLPLVHLTARAPLIGEETFALGAYLGRWPAHIASLIIQDVARLLLVAAILVGVLLSTLGLL